MAKINILEKDVMNACCEYLHYQKYFFFRVNNVGVFDSAKGVHRTPTKWSMKGVSDIIVLWRGQMYFIEFKSTIGKQSPEQEAFEAMAEDNGGTYHIVRSANDIELIFPNHA